MYHYTTDFLFSLCVSIYAFHTFSLIMLQSALNH